MENETKANKTMTCEACEVKCQRFGKHRNGLARFRCPQCHKTYTEAHTKTLGSMYIPEATMLLAVRLLLECNSIRSTERATGLHRDTIMKLLVIAGEKCERVMAKLIVLGGHPKPASRGHLKTGQLQTVSQDIFGCTLAAATPQAFSDEAVQ
jgi:transposase-like protein